MTTGLLTPTHIAILLIVVLLLFGARRLPETGRALGRSMHEFKQAVTGHDRGSIPDHRSPLTAVIGEDSKAPDTAGD